jgi:hypothetical protein
VGLAAATPSSMPERAQNRITINTPLAVSAIRTRPPEQSVECTKYQPHQQLTRHCRRPRIMASFFSSV